MKYAKRRKEAEAPVNVIYKGEACLLGRFGEVTTGQQLTLKTSEWVCLQKSGEAEKYELVEAGESETKTDAGGLKPAGLPTGATADIDWANTGEAELLELKRDQLYEVAQEIERLNGSDVPARSSKQELVEFILAQAVALGWK